jgi:hypothetical protein
MVGAGGIEPPNGGIKIRCLTAWLRPRKHKDRYQKTELTNFNLLSSDACRLTSDYLHHLFINCNPKIKPFLKPYIRLLNPTGVSRIEGNNFAAGGHDAEHTTKSHNFA